jgi:16S rRNA (cytosine967-C5)-methyltransferase
MSYSQAPMSDEPLSLSIRSAREAALRVLEEHRVTGMWVSDLLDKTFRESRLPSNERPLATELACGVIRRQGTLDAILKTLIARPPDQVEVALWTILRLGVYQILILDGIPPHAAVHETVELCKRAARMRWSGFVNGVLRGATRLMTSEFVSKPAADAIPISADRYRKLTKPIFEDPSSHLAGYVGSAFSMPRWLIERWVKRFKPAELLRICFWFNSPPPLVIRANSIRSSFEQVLRSFQESGIVAQPLEGTESIIVEGVSRVDQLPGFTEGAFAVQDYSASQAAIRLSPKPGQSVWDVCAAPGGKSSHLAAIMQNEGRVLATDIRSDRLEIVNENADRLGASIVRTQLIDEAGFRLPDGPFDAILVDVPCSNTGVLGKRPEARWRITPDGMDALTDVQANLLGKALERLAPGGRLLYSTCSIEPSENQQLVQRVLKHFPNARLTSETEFIAGQPADGAYQALIEVKP